MQIGTGYTAVAAGGGTSMALKSDGSLWAWGGNDFGQVGDGTTINRWRPMQIGMGYTAVVTSGVVTVATKSDGTLWAWGHNIYGMVGDGTTSDRWSPVQIGAGGYTAVAAGPYFAVALKSDGSLWAWGDNQAGQHGDGTHDRKLSPVQVGTGYTAVAAGEGHTVALKSDGSLWTWGANDAGQLGDGGLTNRSIPWLIDTGYTAVAAGNVHTVALKSDGSLWAWGWNASGQLGIGTFSDVYGTCNCRTGPQEIIPAPASGSSTTTSSTTTSSTTTSSTTTSSTTTSSTTTSSTTTTTLPGGAAINFVPGWNLAGNGYAAPLDVPTAFGTAAKVTTVWKWVATKSSWAFYAPSLTGQALSDYAVSKGYEILTTVDGGEGFWVNANESFTLALPSGASIDAISFQEGKPGALKQGWNLISIGNARTPSAFNSDMGATPPSAGVVPINITSLWAWDNPLGRWYFYAPSLEAQGGTALTDYITSKGYLDFTANGKALGLGVGFWVNKP